MLQGLKEREKQKRRKILNTKTINNAINEIAKLTNEKSNLELEQDKIEAEVGPIKYIAELIYGEQARDHFDKA